MRVAFLVSDHGWGHLNRSLVLAKALRRRQHPLLVVVSPAMELAVRDALPGVSVVTGRLDQGYVFGAGGNGADAAATRPLLAACAGGPDGSLVAAVAAWRPNLVLADATPWAPRVAEATSVPSVLCSNFSWDDQYSALYEGYPCVAEEIRAVHEHVRAFTVALELPLGPGASGVASRQTLPLIARRPSGKWPAGLPQDRTLVTWTFGRTPPEAQPLAALTRLAELCSAHGAILVLNERLRGFAAEGAHFVPDDVAWPDILAASSLVISKAGYSTVAETLRGSAYVVALGVTGLSEEGGMLAEIERRGFGVGVPADTADVTEAMVRAAGRLLALPPRAPLLEAGEESAVDALEWIAASSHR